LPVAWPGGTVDAHPADEGEDQVIRSEVPDLYWSPARGLIEERDGVWWKVSGDRESLRHAGLPNERPADAVRLGTFDQFVQATGADVGKLRGELAELRSILGAPDGQPLAAWARAFVDERNELAEEGTHTLAAHESTQRALINVERDRNAWKEAAGVDRRDLDTSPAQAAARNAPRCLARSERHSCWMIAEHPGQVHWDMSQGWPQPWALPDTSWRNVLLVPADQLQDAPEALRSMRHDCEDCAGAENCPVHDGPEWSDVHAEEGQEEP
jgi:hypothetical protein